MCSGKTTAGRLLSEKLGWEFLDVDEEIERTEGITIPEIFEKKGEKYFRKLEREVLEKFSQRENVVISTGGGLGANSEAMKAMKEKGLVVWLKVSFEDFLKRCAKDKNRPLLRRSKEELRKLLEEREKVYREAHITLSGGDPAKMAREIVSAIKTTGEGGHISPPSDPF